MPINRRINKEDVVHIYNGILLSHRKEENWVICGMWIGLESGIQSKVSPKEKLKYGVLICPSGI